MTRRTWAFFVGVAVVACLASSCGGCGQTDEPAPLRARSIHSMLVSDATAGFSQATYPAHLEFPRDHGPHAGFRVEWWYFTGSLTAAGGRAFGYQFTVFRRALRPSTEALPSASATAWGTNDIYMAHFALTDVTGVTHQAYERVARGAVGLAGAQGQPFRVWVEDWRAESQGERIFPIHVVAHSGDTAIDLMLTDAKPMVLHGEDGFSVKTRDAAAGSYYYSFTRVNTEGTVVVGGSRHEVLGTSWIDREWSTSVLDANHAGWDWFSLQFDDGTELTCFRMRHVSGPAASYVAGMYIDSAGRSRSLTQDDIAIEELDTWASATSGATYPSRWRITVPSERLSTTVVASVPDQEMALSFVYWEGAVRASGSKGETPITGRGYVEMTGYASGGAAP